MELEGIGKLLDIMATLRGENGCPWDKEQTIQSVRPHIVEEAFETVEAIDEFDKNDKKSIAELKKELGDLLLQVVFVAQMASEEKLFDFNAIVEVLSAKLISRHPHVFGKEKIKTSDEVLKRWNLIKKERESHTHLLDGIPKSMPSVLLAQRYAERAASVGFDWNNAREVTAKIEEEKSELFEAIESKNQENIEEEFGDLLFVMVNLGRKLGLNSEKALKQSALKFKRRFDKMEELDPNFIEKSQPIEVLEALWQRAKKELQKK